MKTFLLADYEDPEDTIHHAIVMERTIADAAKLIKAEIVQDFAWNPDEPGMLVIRILKSDMVSLGIDSLTNLLDSSKAGTSGDYIIDLVLRELPLVTSHSLP